MRSLVDGSRATIVGNLVGLRATTYGANGAMNMLQFEVHDQTGSIASVVWDDAYPTFSSVLKNGATYKFVGVNVRANPRQNGRLELKIYPDTKLEAHAPLKIAYAQTTIAELKEGMVCARVVLAQKADEPDTMRGEEVFRAMFADKTGDVAGVLVGEATKAGAVEGDVVEVEGRFAPEQRTAPTLYAHVLRKIDDKELAAFWETTREEHKAKKLKTEPVALDKLAGIKALEVGARAEFKGMVRSCGLTPQTLANGRVKHSLSIVDDSLAAVDVGVFCEAGTPFQIEIGDVVKMQGSVSSYNTKSITTNAVTKVPLGDALYEWWSKNSSAVFDELSYDSRGGPA